MISCKLPCMAEVRYDRACKPSGGQIEPWTESSGSTVSLVAELLLSGVSRGGCWVRAYFKREGKHLVTNPPRLHLALRAMSRPATRRTKTMTLSEARADWSLCAASKMAGGCRGLWYRILCQTPLSIPPSPSCPSLSSPDVARRRPGYVDGANVPVWLLSLWWLLQHLFLGQKPMVDHNATNLNQRLVYGEVLMQHLVCLATHTLTPTNVKINWNAELVVLTKAMGYGSRWTDDVALEMGLRYHRCALGLPRCYSSIEKSFCPSVHL